MHPDGFLMGLSSIAWREAWKYGERAFRYCRLDTGHALAAISYAASTLGLRVSMLSEATDGGVRSLYHLAIGVPLDDPRITTHPPYSR